MPRPPKFLDDHGKPVKPQRLHLLIHPEIALRARISADRAGLTLGNWVTVVVEAALKREKEI